MAPPPTVSAPPTVAPPPPAKDVPWWGALILAILTAIVSVIATLYWVKGTRPSVPGAPPGVGVLFTDIITFLPHILILFGVLADIFTLQGVYSIPSLIGLASIPIHYVLQFLWTGVAGLIGDIYKMAMTTPEEAAAAKPLFTGTSTKPGMAGGAMSAWAGCEVYGFEGLKSPYAPQGLVVTATIFWYYLIDLWSNRHGLDSTATALAFPLFFGLQVMQLKTCDDLAGSVAIKSLIALAEGLLIGGSGYGIMQASAPNRLPSSILPQGPSLSSLTKNAAGEYVDAEGNVYIIGPDGRPISKSFITAATTPPANGGTGAGMVGASATTCPK